MGKMKNLMADEWDRAYRQGYDDALAEHLGSLSQILDSPAPSAVQTEQQTLELQGKWDAVIAAIEAMPTIEDQMEYAYLDLTVPEILAILKDIFKDTQ